MDSVHLRGKPADRLYVLCISIIPRVPSAVGGISCRTQSIVKQRSVGERFFDAVHFKRQFGHIKMATKSGKVARDSVARKAKKVVDVEEPLVDVAEDVVSSEEVEEDVAEKTTMFSDSDDDSDDGVVVDEWLSGGESGEVGVPGTPFLCMLSFFVGGSYMYISFRLLPSVNIDTKSTYFNM
jgi:hypothetical protein